MKTDFRNLFSHAAPRKHRDRQEQEMVKREIESTDKGIDRLVYELYGLTEEEIETVEYMPDSMGA